ncbi:hypothetical protein BHE74_00012837 [Ensete ventricosum]|nr:hypothetical protein GW17_00023587 [Ensete ventricosum]RWW78908.1 hypothetical protein BHE74_00012837 [Ensete ventricosum]RZR78040.1 hypothetical protein BHM03_00003262 [Ensete ventricosum]
MFLVAAEDLKGQGTAPVTEDLAIQAPCSHWFTRGTSQETGLDTHVRMPLHPSYFGDTCQVAKFDEDEEIFSPDFNYFNRKHVAIGMDHQTDIPELRSHEFKNHTRDYHDCSPPLTPLPSSSSSENLIIDGGVSDKWLGAPVMPMPDSTLLASDGVVLHHNTDCSCPDEGSIRCLRQHVMEAREKLMRKLGHERFVGLGFSDMGEVVGQKWTEEEEQLFHEVVLSNPASLGKNFWEKLPQVFPARSSKELVSYYFNVYMLRKRAAQNRLEPLHVDSDNDEWQESDDAEFATEEEDEVDSVVDSPLADEDAVSGEEDDPEEADIMESTDDTEDSGYYTFAGSDEKWSCHDVKGCTTSESNLFSSMQFTRSNSNHCFEEQDIQDHSCTFYDGQHNVVDFCDPVDIFHFQRGLIGGHESLHKESQNNGLSGLTDNGFFCGHHNLKAWDMSYSSGIEKEDFLSTCDVIDEVFGEEPWESENLS